MVQSLHFSNENRKKMEFTQRLKVIYQRYHRYQKDQRFHQRHSQVLIE